MAVSSKTVAGDYLSEALGIAVERFLELRLTKVIKVTTPLAGADWSVNVPGGVIWEVLGVKAALSTSAVVATRIGELQFTDGDGVTIARIPPASTLAASATLQNFWSRHYGSNVNAGGVSAAGMPGDMPLPNGYRVRSSTFGIDVADQWTSIVLTVREWSETDVTQELMEMVAQFDSLTERVVTGR